MKNFMGALIQNSDDVEQFVVKMTADIAKSWLEKFKYPHQRQIRPRNVERLHGITSNGVFKTAATNIAFGKLPDGRLLLENGQHMLSDLSRLPREESRDVIVSVAKVKDMKDAAIFYMALDNNSTRTITDILSASGMTTAFPAIPRRLISTSVTAMRFVTSNFAKSLLSLDKIFLTKKVLDEYSSELQEFYKIVSSTKSDRKIQLKFAGNSGLMAVSLVRLKRKDLTIKSFIPKVLDLIGIRLDDPAIVVRSLMIAAASPIPYENDQLKQVIVISPWHFAVLLEAACLIDEQQGSMNTEEARKLLTNKNVMFGDRSVADIKSRMKMNGKSN